MTCRGHAAALPRVEHGVVARMCVLDVMDGDERVVCVVDDVEDDEEEGRTRCCITADDQLGYEEAETFLHTTNQVISKRYHDCGISQQKCQGCQHIGRPVSDNRNSKSR